MYGDGRWTTFHFYTVVEKLPLVITGRFYMLDLYGQSFSSKSIKTLQLPSTPQSQL